jgi:hypothetical protein
MKSLKITIATICVAVIGIGIFTACEKENDFMQKNTIKSKSEHIQKAVDEGESGKYNYETCVTSDGYSGTWCIIRSYVRFPCSTLTGCTTIYDKDGNPVPVPEVNFTLDSKETVIAIWDHLEKDYDSGLLLVSPEEIYEKAE